MLPPLLNPRALYPLPSPPPLPVPHLILRVNGFCCAHILRQQPRPMTPPRLRSSRPRQHSAARPPSMPSLRRRSAQLQPNPHPQQPPSRQRNPPSRHCRARPLFPPPPPPSSLLLPRVSFLVAMISLF